MNIPTTATHVLSSDCEKVDVEQRNDLQFPWKLHRILEHTEKSGQDSIVSWLPDGTSFRIHLKKEFSEQIMPTFFNTTKFKSFQRNLNLWGFETIGKGPNKGARFHRFFVKGKPALCKSMTRVKVKGQSTRPRYPSSAERTRSGLFTRDGHPQDYPAPYQAHFFSNSQEAEASLLRTYALIRAPSILPTTAGRLQQVSNRFDYPGDVAIMNQVVALIRSSAAQPSTTSLLGSSSPQVASSNQQLYARRVYRL
jgi:hypothetical protein